MVKKYMLKKYRHGDLCLIGIKKTDMPKDLEKTETNVIMCGSGGHDHTVENAVLYLKKTGNFIIGYMEAKHGCKLFHLEHGKKIANNILREAEITPGFYELRKQCEDTNEGMKPVID